jgi:Chloramphenicol phosphotransferase-like protein
MSAIARIIILNGVGSSGKSSTAKALQAIVTEPFLHVTMDNWNHPDTFSYRIESEEGKPTVAIETGPLDSKHIRKLPRWRAHQWQHAQALPGVEALTLDARLPFNSGRPRQSAMNLPRT